MPSPKGDTPAEIAASLTEPQRRLLLALWSARLGRYYPSRWEWISLKKLAEKGLAVVAMARTTGLGADVAECIGHEATNA